MVAALGRGAVWERLPPERLTPVAKIALGLDVLAVCKTLPFAFVVAMVCTPMGLVVAAWIRLPPERFTPVAAMLLGPDVLEV